MDYAICIGVSIGAGVGEECVPQGITSAVWTLQEHDKFDRSQIDTGSTLRAAATARQSTKEQAHG